MPKVKVKLTGFYAGSTPGDYIEVDPGQIRDLITDGVVAADELSKRAAEAMESAGPAVREGDNTPGLAASTDLPPVVEDPGTPS